MNLLSGLLKAHKHFTQTDLRKATWISAEKSHCKTREMGREGKRGEKEGGQEQREGEIEEEDKE